MGTKLPVFAEIFFDFNIMNANQIEEVVKERQFLSTQNTPFLTRIIGYELRVEFWPKLLWISIDHAGKSSGFLKGVKPFVRYIRLAGKTCPKPYI